MNWFWIAIIGYFLSGLVLVLDKFILTKSVGKPIVYAFYSTIFMLAVFLAAPFGASLLHGLDWLWAVVSGFGFGFGLWFMFIAVKKGEASHINPFLGGIITILVFLLSNYFLQEKLLVVQVLGVIILTLACLFLSSEKSQKHHGFHTGFLWAILAGLCFATSHVSAKYIYDIYGFFTGLIWTKGAVGLVGLILLLSPSVRHSLHKKNNQDSKTSAKRHAMLIVIADKVLGVGAVLLIQYAIAIGSVTVVNALVGIQYTFMFLVIYLFTKFLPRVFKEYFTKRELMIEVIAIILVILGSALFVL